MKDYLLKNYKVKTKKEMAKDLNVSYGTIDWELKKLNLTKYKSIKYSESELIFITENYPKYGAKYCADILGRSRIALNKKAKKIGLSINWKYEYICTEGYIVNCEDRNNRKAVHRQIMESVLGRPLNKNDIVHHINEDKTDNRVENLIVITRAEHLNIHRNNFNKVKI